MKNINKIIALLLISLLSIGNTYAEGFPDEPMVIYGNITGVTNGATLKIFDGNNVLLKETKVLNGKYGTNATFDLTNKIVLNGFSGKLIFKIDGYNYIGTSLGEIKTCEVDSTFQKGNICQYNLTFSSNVSVGTSSGGSSSGTSGSSSSSSSSSSVSTPNTEDSINSENTSEKTIVSETGTKENSNNQVNSNVKRNDEGKIIIKGSDYIKTLKTFIKTKRVETKILGKDVITIKGDTSYNKNVEANVKQIFNEIQLDSIRKSMIKNLDRITTTYGIYTDPNLSEELKEIYKEKLREDKEYYELKLKKLIRKDEILRYGIEKKKLKAKK